MKTIIVAGIIRSGLTVTMQMLNAGGYQCFGAYPAFENYEIGKINWDEARGKAIKLVDAQLQFPPSGKYHVIRLHRNESEQAKSIAKFTSLIVGHTISREDRRKIEKSLEPDYRKIDAWAKQQSALLNLRFEHIIRTPKYAAELIRDFVGVKLNIDKMVAVVEKRNPECYPTMMEEKFLNQ